MIEKEQREAERRPITKITHKGEIEIESLEPVKAPETAEVRARSNNQHHIYLHKYKSVKFSYVSLFPARTPSQSNTSHFSRTYRNSRKERRELPTRKRHHIATQVSLI